MIAVPHTADPASDADTVTKPMPGEAPSQYLRLSHRLPSTVLAVPHLTARERRNLFNATDPPTVFDTAVFLNGSASKRVLRETFNTDRRRSRAIEAETEFRQITTNWLTGSRRDKRFTWLLPDPLVHLSPDPGPPDREYRTLLQTSVAETHDTNLTDLVSRLSNIPYLEDWLPFVSLRLCFRLNNFRQSDFSTIRAALAKGASFLNYSRAVRPWHKGYPTQLGCLPIRWLFIHERSNRFETLLLRLEKCGLTNVKQLAVFYPPAFDFLKRTDSRNLIPLLQAFKNV